MTRLSGLQKAVLALYRRCLREAQKKPSSSREHFTEFAKREFRKGMAVDKRDYSTIEFMLRKGERQVDMYSADGVKDIR